MARTGEQRRLRLATLCGPGRGIVNWRRGLGPSVVTGSPPSLRFWFRPASVAAWAAA